MHADQVDIDVGTVARLVAEQFPRWRDLPVRPVPSYGTVNALFRVGDEVVVRFPLQPGRESERRAELVSEQDNARRLAGHVAVEIPEPLALGEPGDGYPGSWAAYRWIPGETANPDDLVSPDRFARDLAAFVGALRGIDTGGRQWDGTSRGGPLSSKDEGVRDALAASTSLVDTSRLTTVWETCLAAPAYAGAPVWIHADLMPGNLLVRNGRLAAVIDLGSLCVGDPAVDLMPAWCLFDAATRAAYRTALDVDDLAWERGRGWAIVQAIIALPYYVHTNAGMADTARRTLAAVLE